MKEKRFINTTGMASGTILEFDPMCTTEESPIRVKKHHVDLEEVYHVLHTLMNSSLASLPNSSNTYMTKGKFTDKVH